MSASKTIDHRTIAVSRAPIRVEINGRLQVRSLALRLIMILSLNICFKDKTAELDFAIASESINSVSDVSAGLIAC